jgi:hypothetical protein
MLHSIDNTGKLEWYCPGNDENECGALLTTSIDEAVYQEAPDMRVLGRGAAIALPKCPCGVQIILKADWTLKELYKVLVAFQDEQGAVWGYGLRFGHVYSLQLHWMLYQQGKASYPPVLDLPPQAVLSHKQFEGVDPRVVAALWCGFHVVRQLTPEALHAGHLFAQIAGPIS